LHIGRAYSWGRRALGICHWRGANRSCRYV